jgi:hypothetical protein
MVSMRPAMPTVVAFLVAPLIAAFSLSVAGSVETGLTNFSLLVLLGWTVVFYFYAALATAVLGLPSFLLLRKLGVVRWWSAILVGIAVGIVVFVLVDPRGLAAVLSEPRSIVWGGIGALSAFAFWAIWRRGQMRPAES